MRNAVRAATLVVLVLLAGCRMSLDMTVVSEQEVTTSMDIAFDLEQAELLDLSSDNLCEQMDVPDSDGVRLRLEPIDTADEVGCRMSVTGALSDVAPDAGLSLEDGIWTFILDETSRAHDTNGMGSSDSDGDFRVSVTFPGEVLSQNGSSRVEGTTVIWDNLADFTRPDGLRATARAQGSPADVGAPGAAEGQAAPGDASRSGSGLDEGDPVDESMPGSSQAGDATGSGSGGAIAIGLAVLVAAIAIFLIIRGRRKGQASSFEDVDPEQTYPPQADPTDGAQDFGQPGAELGQWDAQPRTPAPSQQGAAQGEPTQPRQWVTPVNPPRPQASSAAAKPSRPDDPPPPQDQERPDADAGEPGQNPST